MRWQLLLVWLRHVAIHVKVAGRRWQVHLQALELLRQDDLARQPARTPTAQGCTDTKERSAAALAATLLSYCSFR
jgi:hypothetical protein